MNENTPVSVGQPEVTDPLTELLLHGSRELIARAVEAEFAVFLATYDAALDDDGRRQVVRNGYLPEREVQTGIGSVFVRVPRARDRSGSGIVFHSNLLPTYLRRTKSIEELVTTQPLASASVYRLLSGHDSSSAFEPRAV